jgi:hypothetical protein
LLGDLKDGKAVYLQAVGQVMAKGGAMFAAAQQINNPVASSLSGTSPAPSPRA